MDVFISAKMPSPCFHSSLDTSCFSDVGVSVFLVFRMLEVVVLVDWEEVSVLHPIIAGANISKQNMLFKVVVIMVFVISLVN